MDALIFGIAVIVIAGIAVADRYFDKKKQKAFEAAQKVIKDQIASLEAKLKELKR